jgi:small subunit ribosomal protein S19
MPKEFLLRGRNFDDIQKMSLKEFAGLLPSRQRRSLLRGFTEQEKIFLEKVKSNSLKLRTHCRDLIIVPDMVGKAIKIHNGKEFVEVRVEKDMLGHRLGEFAATRSKVAHSAPGIGATRSSSALSVR